MYKKVRLKKNLYGSLGTFCAQIGQLFEAPWVFQVYSKIDKLLLSKENVVDFFKNILLYLNGRMSKIVQYIQGGRKIR